MNGKRSVHTFDESLVDAMIEKLSAQFEHVEFKKEPVIKKEEAKCYTNTMEPSTTETSFTKKQSNT
jgi:hypothetical protein